ncbi:MAG TPA: N-acetylmuramoyl-L-alanine amidase [Chloroflexota bacterium]|nr:N-acetylmuramoyl-L-alanine amidase [Chloroflexota bacterium]
MTRRLWDGRVESAGGIAGVRLAVGAALLLLVCLLIPPAAGARELVTPDVGTLTQTALGVDDPEAIAQWIDTEAVPIPQEPQEALSTLRARGASGWSRFRTPFPKVPVWNPPCPKRVGLQAGHWLFNEAPDELADLRSNPGTSGGGKAEWEVTLDIAQRTATLLQGAGVQVDILPTTIPVRYRANAFVAIHADGDNGGALNGYKVAGSGWTGTPEADAALVDAINQEYAATTGLPRRDEQISLRMRWYYGFNARRYQHAVAPGVPQAIIETGFLTNAGDRQLLIGNPDRIAAGIAAGILDYLNWEAATQ